MAISPGHDDIFRIPTVSADDAKLRPALTCNPIFPLTCLTGTAALNTFHNHGIADFQMVHIGAHIYYSAAEFMAGDDRIFRHTIFVVSQGALINFDISGANSFVGDPN